MKNYRHVFDDLYVGGHESSKNSSDGFDIIVSMASPSENTDYNYSINDGEHKYTKFRNAVDTIINELRSDKKVLVHCSAGLSRSVAVCVATQVCHYENIGYITAIQNARSNTRMPENELMRSAERYIKNNSSNSSQIDVSNEIEKFTQKILDDIEKENDNISKDKIKVIIAENIKQWAKKPSKNC